MPPTSPRAGWPWAVLLGGLSLLALGALLAASTLPEWRTGSIPPPAFFAQRFRQLSAEIGWQPAPGEISPYLAASNLYDRTAADLGRGALPWLAGSRTAIVVEVERPLAEADGGTGIFTADFALDGTPYHFDRMAPDPSRIFSAAPPETKDDELLASRVLRAGERLGPPEVTRPLSGGRNALYPVAGRAGASGDHALVMGNWLARNVQRAAGRPRTGPSAGVLFILRRLALVLAGLVLFFVLLVRRQISLVNGALIGALTLLLSIAEVDELAAGSLGNLFLVAAVVGSGVWTMVLWSTGESLLRTSQDGLTTSLDALRRARLGPRAGRALLAGLGAGAGIAGLRLAAAALAARAPGVLGAWPLATSVSLPIFSLDGTGFAGVRAAALAAFALGLGRRFAPPRWATPAAVAAALLVLPWAPLHPWPLALVLSLAVAAAFVEVGRRAGLTALLTAGLASGLLPAAVFAAGRLDWLTGTFAAAAGGSMALLALGLAGLGRPAEVEEGRLVPPAFMRRLEDERRLKYEMDLLTRMQLGLLPERVPSPAGWEIAARSLLASEAGGDLYDFLHPEGPLGPLWIAAGDVAGHGYSCAIAQAMTVSALSSLIVAESTPAGVLAEIDRVLRRGSGQRNFTTLALLRLDPQTGEALLANAGHPFPLLLTAGTMREIDLPGLPLGQGPQREYRDLAISVPPGGVLVLASDGLFEGVNRRGEAYGFERPSAVVRAVARRPAEAILDALLADWHRHLDDEEPADDTTVLVIKRR